MKKILEVPHYWLIALIFISFIVIPQVEADTLSNKIYLPILSKPPCLSSSQEIQLAQLLEQDSGQQRVSLTCNNTLAQVAHARAADMAAREYFSHVNPDGYGPNYLVEQAGYTLPSFYGDEPSANNIESIAAGYTTPELTWQRWLESPSHRSHLLGESSFFADQIEYGVGYAYDPDSPYRHYWVVITARPGP